MMKFVFVALSFVCSLGHLNAQWSITSANTPETIDFDNNLPGVNEGQFGASGYHPTPVTGQLNSNAWSLTGMSDGDILFGDTGITGDFTRGTSTGGVVTGGIYSFEVSPGDFALGVQPIGGDFNAGSHILKIRNSTGSAVSAIDLSYEIWVFNDQERANSFNFSYSTDNITFSDIPALDYTSPEAADISPVWILVNRSTTIPVSLNNGADIYIRWTGKDVSGGSSRDEFALDDIVVSLTASGACTPPSTPAFNLFFSTVTNNSIDVNWSRGSGDSVLVIAKETASPASSPVNGTRYIASSVYTMGDNLGSGNFAVYTGTGTSVTVTGLNAATDYEFSVYEFTTMDVCYSPAVSNDTITDCSTPDEVSGESAVSGNKEVSLAWTNGNCYDTILVIVNAGAPVSTIPTGASYAADPVYGSGANPSGSEYVVYSGTGNSVAVTNLTNSTPYYFKIFQRKGANWSAGVEVTETPTALPTANDAWINEFHYDNDGADVNEWVEIVIKDTVAYNLADFSITHYNGSGGSVIESVTIDDTILHRNSDTMGFAIATYKFSSLQNGPDALALIYQDSNVCQFISYEDSLIATDGPAIGFTSVDIGVEESSSTPLGKSLQLRGSGTRYSDFTWAVDVDTTWGQINEDQYFGEVVSYEFNGSWMPSDPSGIATAVDTMKITAGNATLNAGTTVNKLSIAAGGSLDLGGNVLTVEDTAFLYADASGYAQVIGEIDGLTYWESYLESASPRWFNVGTPIDVQLNDLNFTNGGFLQATGNSATTNIFSYNAAAIGVNDPEGDWEIAADLSLEADSIGYSVFLGSPHFGSLPMTMSATGNLLNGDIDLPLVPQAAVPSTDGWGWNFVPNPYPSTLDWDGIAANPANSSISTIYWIFNDELNQWVAYNSASGLLPPPTGNGGGANAFTGQFIAPGQAFFIQSVSTSQSTLHLENDDRVLDQSPIKQKQLSAIPNSITIWVTDGISHRSDFTWIGFEQGTTDDWDDRREGVKRFNNIDQFPALYFPAYGKDFVYNFVSDDFNSRQIPLSFKFGRSSHITMQGIPDYMEPGWSVILEDKVSGTFTDLRVSSYIFQHDPLNAADRFLLHINQAGIGMLGEQINNIFAYSQQGIVVVNLQSYSGEDTNLELFDMRGTLTYREEGAAGSTVELATDGYAKGIYILKVKVDDRTIHTQKVSVHQ